MIEQAASSESAESKHRDLPPAGPALPRSADDALPPVQAPTAGFLLQLFLIPLVIVSIIIMVWLMFSWLAQMGNDPAELVGDLKRLNEGSWQKALTLANLLRNPEYEELKRDHTVARELADVLDQQIEAAGMNEKQVRLRLFLCRALGEFQVDDGLPALVRAATTERDPVELDVRRAAIEAIAVLAKQLGAETLLKNEPLMTALGEALVERGDRPDDQVARGELRATAAFTLGVIGGDASLEKLKSALDDPYANARYNAATGLARHGHPAAVPVILEMLDPANEQAIHDETLDSGRQWKQVLVLTNGIRSAQMFAAESAGSEASARDLDRLRSALEKLAEADVSPKVALAAREAVRTLPAGSP